MEATPCFPATNLFLLLLFLCYSSSVIQWKGKPQHPGCSWQSTRLCSLISISVYFCFTRHKTAHNDWAKKTKSVSKWVCWFPSMYLVLRSKFSRQVYNLTHSSGHKNYTHWPVFGNSPDVCSTFRNVTLTHSLSSSRSPDTSHSHFLQEWFLAKYAKTYFWKLVQGFCLRY